MYTEVEGLLSAILDGMSENHPIFLGDSAIEEKRKQYGEFMAELKKMKEGKRAFTLDIVDPLANSWIYSDCAPNPDPRLEVVDYDRTWEEDEALGLHDMVVDDKEVEELKKSYEERLEALNEALKKDGAGSKDVMRKRIAAETEKSRKNEEKAKELTRKAKENIFTIKQKDKEIESLKLKLKQVEEENQKAIAALKKQNNAELTKLQKELSEKEMEIEQLKERI